MATDIGKLRGMTPAEMGQEESDLREEIWKLRLQVTTGQLQDPNKVREVRRDLARVLTIRRQIEIAAVRADKS